MIWKIGTESQGLWVTYIGTQFALLLHTAQVAMTMDIGIVRLMIMYVLFQIARLYDASSVLDILRRCLRREGMLDSTAMVGFV